MKKISSRKNSDISRTQRGVSLIEVLIALLITAVGLLGFAALQARALQSTEESYSRAQAAAIAQDMVERQQSNFMSADMDPKAESRDSRLTALRAAYGNAGAWNTAVQNCSATCTELQMVAADQQQIRTIAQRVLPNGSAVMGVCGSIMCAYVGWGGTTAGQCMASGGTGAECVYLPGI